MVSVPEGGDLPPGIDFSRPHTARMYDYLLGGKDHFAVDRETMEAGLQSWPGARVYARENRKFLARAVEYLTREAGVRQFLDVGTGLPTGNNVHEVAQRAAPDSRVVYMDNDPLVIPDEDDPGAIVATLMAGLPPGSYLVSSHVTAELDPDGVHGMERAYQAGGLWAGARTAAEFGRTFFTGLEFVDPGLVLISDWRATGGESAPLAREVSSNGAVARKPLA